MELIYIARENKLEELKTTYSRRVSILKIQIKAGPETEKEMRKQELVSIRSKYKEDVQIAKESYKTKKIEVSAVFDGEIEKQKNAYKALKEEQTIEKKKLKAKYTSRISSLNNNEFKEKIEELKNHKQRFISVQKEEYANSEIAKRIAELQNENAIDTEKLALAKKNHSFSFNNPFKFKDAKDLKVIHKEKMFKIKENLPEDKLKAKEVIFVENKRYREELISFKNSKTNEETISEGKRNFAKYEIKKIKSAISARKDAIKELKVRDRKEKMVFDANHFANKENKAIYKNNKKIDTAMVMAYEKDPKNIIKLKYKNDLLELKKEANKSKNLIGVSKNEKGIAVFGSTEKADPKARSKKSLMIGLITILLIMFLLPFLLLLNTSFKSAMDMFSGAVLNLPKPATMVPYSKVMHVMTFWHSLMWSLIIVIASNVIIIVISSMAAWVLIRRKEWYSKLIFYTILTVMIVPFQAIMLPLMMNAGKMHMLNIYGLIFMYTGFGVGLSIFMMHGFLKSVPVALEEAAAVSGAGPIKTFIKVVFPIMKPIFITLFVLNTVWIWNDFLLPSLVLTDMKGPQTLPVKLYQGAVGTFGTRWNILMAGVTLLIIPTIVYFIFAQKYIISGVTQGAIK